jgi:hypothetical protein
MVGRRNAHSFGILALQFFGVAASVNTCAAVEVKRGGDARAHALRQTTKFVLTGESKSSKRFVVVRWFLLVLLDSTGRLGEAGLSHALPRRGLGAKVG